MATAQVAGRGLGRAQIVVPTEAGALRADVRLAAGARVRVRLDESADLGAPARARVSELRRGLASRGLVLDDFVAPEPVSEAPEVRSERAPAFAVPERVERLETTPASSAPPGDEARGDGSGPRGGAERFGAATSEHDHGAGGGRGHAEARNDSARAPELDEAPAAAPEPPPTAPGPGSLRYQTPPPVGHLLDRRL